MNVGTRMPLVNSSLGRHFGPGTWAGIISHQSPPAEHDRYDGEIRPELGPLSPGGALLHQIGEAAAVRELTGVTWYIYHFI
jgi:hypothetical protein